MKPSTEYLKPLALAVAGAVGLLTGEAQALTASRTYELGPQDAGTTINVARNLGSIGNLIPWIPQATLPPGSILRSVSANIRLDSSTSDSGCNDFYLYFDSNPAAAGTAALMQLGGDYNGMVATVGQKLAWGGGWNGPGTTITTTKTGADWSGEIDLNTVQLSLGNNYATSSWSGTVTVEYDITPSALILSFGPGASIDPILKTIAWIVPYGSNLAALTPTLTLSSGNCVPASGASPVLDVNYVFSGQPVAAGSLTKSGSGTLSLGATPANFSNISVNGGTLYLNTNLDSFNIPNVTLSSGATLKGERANMVGGTLTMNGGTWRENNGYGGSWTGPVYLAVDSIIGQDGGWQQTINGTLSGPGGFTCASALVLTASNSYTGPTLVNSGGLLVCQDPASLGNGGSLSIATGGRVGLYTGDHVVASLTLGGVSMPPGTYGSSLSAAPSGNQNDTCFTSHVDLGPMHEDCTGTVNVLAASAYDTWATTTSGLAGSDALAGADPDHDGLANALEFVLGGQPNPARSGSNSTDLLPKVSSNPAGALIFTFERADSSVGAATITFQWSTDLTFPALHDVVVPSAAGTTTINEVEVAITDGSPNDTIVITVPAAKAAGNKLFGRLQVSVP